MSSSIRPGQSFDPMLQLKWSHTEKAIARKAFEAALHRELEATIHEAKERARNITEPSQLWDLEEWLGKRRRAINEKYDYRYSVLPTVFARLLHEKHIGLADLTGLQDDKMGLIRSYLELWQR